MSDEVSKAVMAKASTFNRSTAIQLIRQYLSAFVPGYTVFAELLSSRLGVDSDKVLAIFGFWVAGWAGLTYLKNTVIPYIATSFTSAIVIKGHDYGHNSLDGWLKARSALTRSRLLWSQGWNVESKGNSDDPEEDEDNEPAPAKIEDTAYDDPNKLFNFSRVKATKRLEWSPDDGVYWFFHRWRPYLVQRANRESPGSAERGQYLKLFTLGYSRTPLENIVQEAVDERLDARLQETTIWRANGSQWTDSTSRPTRPLNTISVDPDIKRQLLTDINTFLNPRRSDWYAARGVPYRRGYLFHGPPGCGKTSLAFSLAGSFGLDVYMCNLVSGYINESDLNYLMTELPERCVFVLEDIDAIAVDREKAKGDPTYKDSLKSSDRQGCISLSGLLNALDGFFAHEGHILIMTSNYPQHLDAAILRPGRVDRQIEFTLMTRPQIVDIFVRMFGSTQTNRIPPSTLDVATRPFEPNVDYPGCPYETPDELFAAAHEFAAKFPERTFSPAMLQEYLIEYFEDPIRAVRAADGWVTRELAKIEEKKAAAREEAELERIERKRRKREERKERAKLRREEAKADADKKDDSSDDSDDSDDEDKAKKETSKKETTGTTAGTKADADASKTNAETGASEAKDMDAKSSETSKDETAEAASTPAPVNGAELNANGHADVVVNGHTNGDVNGHTNGDVNGHTNGDVNGHTNGDVNGHTNGNVNSQSIDDAKTHAKAVMETLVNGYASQTES